jgi:hypothetical protein
VLPTIREWLPRMCYCEHGCGIGSVTVTATVTAMISGISHGRDSDCGCDCGCMCYTASMTAAMHAAMWQGAHQCIAPDGHRSLPKLGHTSAASAMAC